MSQNLISQDVMMVSDIPCAVLPQPTAVGTKQAAVAPDAKVECCCYQDYQEQH